MKSVALLACFSLIIAASILTTQAEGDDSCQNVDEKCSLFKNIACCEGLKCNYKGRCEADDVDKKRSILFKCKSVNDKCSIFTDQEGCCKGLKCNYKGRCEADDADD